MAFDFGALPPETNSLRMYTGAGAGPMLAAAAAFGALADELNSTALGSQSAIANLTGDEWIGPSSAAMASAVEPYLTWLRTTAGELEHAAAQAMASAAAYEAAFAMTVPPAVVAANRAQLAALLATNVLGQNTAAIAATEAQYGEMWAADAAAMYGYAAASATAARLSPLTAPPPATDQAGGLAPSSAAAATTNGLHQAVSNAPDLVQSLADPTATPLDDILGNSVVSNVGNAAFDDVSWNVFNAIVSGVLYQHTVDTAVPAAAVAGGLGGAGALVAAGAPAGSAATPVLASLGSANAIGALRVPAAWSAATPAAPPPTLAGSEWAAPLDGEPQTTWATGMPAVASAGRGGYGVGPRYGVKPKVMPTQVFV